jgi:hypothetical protein
MSDRPVSKPWNVVRDFIDPETKLCVRITAQNHFRPRYSIAIGRWISPPNGEREDYLGPHIPMMIDIENGSVSLRPFVQIINDLMGQAIEHIHVEAQKREDEILEAKREKELSDANKDKPFTRQTGKTQRTKEKRNGSDTNTQ